MNASFNLTTEPWIPCQFQDQALPQDVSLRDLFRQAQDIREISDPSPLVAASLHRMLLAILHRVFGPATPEEWRTLWEAEVFDLKQIDAYLDAWAHRFDLFDPVWPFYQTSEVSIDKALPVTKLCHDIKLAGATLFDHAVDASPPPFSPARAARELIAHQTFALGGLVTPDHGTVNKSAKSAPLAKGAVTIVRSQKNLFETLMLNLHQYHPGGGIPFEGNQEDRPVWEREDHIQAEDRSPDGYVDLLTWPSRRMLLFPEQTSSGDVVVRYVTIMKGNQPPDSWYDSPREPMLAFKRVLKANEKHEPWRPIAFRPDRVFWRDSLPLFQAFETDGQQYHRPGVLQWLSRLSWTYKYIDRSQTQAVDLYGMASDRQVIDLWRHERFPLPLEYLQNEALFDRLTDAIHLAEEVGRALNRGVRTLAWHVLAPQADLEGGRDPDPAAVSDLADSLEATRIYWARLDTIFRELLVRLPEDVTGADHEPVYGTVEIERWKDVLRATARDAFEETIESFELSARGLKAISRAQPAFNARLNRALDRRKEDSDERAA